MTLFSTKNLMGRSLITPLGGLARLYINQTGETSVAGKWVQMHDSISDAVQLCVINEPDPIGVIFSNGVPVGGYMWVVCSGVAEALFSNAPTAGYLARGFIAADATASYTAGIFLSEAVPSSPFASDKHFYEGGHIMETKTAEGTAKVNLHFN